MAKKVVHVSETPATQQLRAAGKTVNEVNEGAVGDDDDLTPCVGIVTAQQVVEARR